MDQDTAAIIQVAQQSAIREPIEVDPEKRYIVIDTDGNPDVVEPDLALADRIKAHTAGAPLRKYGTTQVLEVDGLAYLWDKHSLAASELYADPARNVITAVLDADNGAGDPAAYQDQRVELVCRLTPSWLSWLKFDGQLMDQKAFAEFIEENLGVITNPSGGEMLEIAQSFEATTNVDFKSVDVVSSGQRAIRYEESIAAKAGQAGEIVIPTTFTVALQPFEGGNPPTAYAVVARFRYRINSGNLLFGYKLERPEDVLRKAFDDVREAASHACDRPALLGTAPAVRH